MARRNSDEAVGATALSADCPVVVLNTHYSGLAVARDLGRLGIRVIGLSAIPASPGNVSRWVEYRAAPDSLSQDSDLCAFLMKLADELGRQRAIASDARSRHQLHLQASGRT